MNQLRLRLDLGIRKTLLPEWRAMLSPEHWQKDLVAGITVACVAVPLSLAIALASGVQPAVGLVSAIVAGIVCAFFGGTRLAVSGPAAAMAVLVGSVVEDHGLAGLLVVGLGCGLLQLITGVTGMGRLVQFVPAPVVAGFTAGIGAIIFIGQLPRVLGLQPPSESHVFDVVRHVGQYVHQTNGAALGVSLATVAIAVGLPKVLPRVPAVLAAVVVSTVGAAALGLSLPTVGSVPRSLPVPHLPGIPEGAGGLATATLMVFALASLETLLSSAAVDKLARGERHDPDQELIGQGLGNMAVALFGGIPVTGVIARSALNVQVGAKTRRSAIIHSLALIATVFALAPVISRIPLAALAGVLLAVSLRMMNPRELLALRKTAPSDAAVYAITFLVIVLGDLLLGVQVGLAAAFVVAAIRLGQGRAELHAHERADHARVVISGPVTFLSNGKMERLRVAVSELPPGKPVAFELYDLTSVDASGAEALAGVMAEVSSRAPVALVGAAPKPLTALLHADPTGRLREHVAQTELDALRLLNPGSEQRPVERLRQGVMQFQRKLGGRLGAVYAELVHGQSPHTLFITCADSRVMPSVMTSTDPGELFLLRNVGNAVPPRGEDETPAELAAVEFAVKALGVSEIVVCGHSGCGAMKAVLGGAPAGMPAVARWVEQLEAVRARVGEGATPEDAAKVNVVLQLEHLMSHAVVRERVEAGALRLHGWYFDIGEGAVLAWDARAGRFEAIGGAEGRAGGERREAAGELVQVGVAAG